MGPPRNGTRPEYLYNSGARLRHEAETVAMIPSRDNRHRYESLTACTRSTVCDGYLRTAYMYYYVGPPFSRVRHQSIRERDRHLSLSLSANYKPQERCGTEQ